MAKSEQLGAIHIWRLARINLGDFAPDAKHYRVAVAGDSCDSLSCHLSDHCIYHESALMPHRYIITVNAWRLVATIMLVTLALFATVALIIIHRSLAERRSPFSYDDVTAPFVYSRTLCPGDELRFDLRLSIQSAPNVVAIVENWQGAYSIPDTEVTYYIQQEKRDDIISQKVTVPDLLSGAWAYERAAIAEGIADAELIRIEFEVRDDCRP